MYKIGVDIGGTKITGALFLNHKPLKELTIATPKNFADFKHGLIKLVDFLSVGEKTYGVGIGMAGLVDAQKGLVVYSPNIKFIKKFELTEFFKLNGYKKVKIDNDANCFTRAELILGHGKKLNNFLALTLGTGIGGGIVVNRNLYRGKNNAGGELGHILVNEEFLETVFKKARDYKNNQALGKILGQAFATLTNIFSPEAIILGGGVSVDKNRHFISIANLEMKKYLFNKTFVPKILVSKINNAGAVGAALLFVED